MHVTSWIGRRIGPALLPAVLILGIFPCSPAAATTPTGWVIVGGATKASPEQKEVQELGTILWSSPEDPSAIPLDQNPTSRGQGSIVTDDECGERPHFHGALYDVEDTGGGCGWGVVVPLLELPKEVADLACAIDREQTALVLAFGSVEPRYGLAAQAIHEAKEYLDKITPAALPRPPYRRPARDLIGIDIKRAKRLDERVSRRLGRLRRKQPEPGDTRRAQQELNRALALKRTAFERMVRARRLLPSE